MEHEEVIYTEEISDPEPQGLLQFFKCLQVKVQALDAMLMEKTAKLNMNTELSDEEFEIVDEIVPENVDVAVSEKVAEPVPECVDDSKKKSMVKFGNDQEIIHSSFEKLYEDETIDHNGNIIPSIYKNISENIAVNNPFIYLKYI